MSTMSVKEKDNFYISPKAFGEDAKKYYDVSEEIDAFTGDRNSKEF